jgi:adenylate cyclase
LDEKRDRAKSLSDEDRKRYPGKPPSNTTNSMVDMIMGSGSGSTDNSGEQKQATVDKETLVAQTQDRMRRALKRRYQYYTNLKPAQEFLLNHINSKIPLVIMYVDLVGSTNQNEHDFACGQSSQYN